MSGAPDLPPGLSDAFTSLVPDGRTQLREGYAEVGDNVRLHYVEAGDGPLIVLLHGFPEFWFGWRLQISPLAAAGFRVVAPDTRGYNLSSRPKGIAAYSADRLADDIRGLIRERGAESAFVVGHDWGGTIAWTMAMKYPDVVDRLAILDAAHPRSLQKGLSHPRQLTRSWYFFFFALPDVPERVVRRDRFRFFQRFLRDARPAYTPQEMDRYVEAWSQPGAPTAMIDYYRCSVRPPKGTKSEIRAVSAPALVIWGQNDRYLGPGVRTPDRADVPNLDRVEQVPDASHWVHHDAHERVTQLLIDFFTPGRQADTAQPSTT
jgi:pimeloyl-ACP methyl ester carboxylesterase